MPRTRGAARPNLLLQRLNRLRCSLDELLITHSGTLSWGRAGRASTAGKTWRGPMPYPEDWPFRLHAALWSARPIRPAWKSTHITVRGARQHNLRNLSVSIPRNTLTVVTGLSGSGKSSLAFDTIYAEGQRRYVETLSAYARQFLDQMERPDVDAIDGLSPAISIEQKTTSRSSALDRGNDHGDLRLPAAAIRVGGPAALSEVRAADHPPDGGADCGADCGAGARREDYGLRAAGARTQGRVPRGAGGAGPAGVPRAHRRRDDGADRGNAAGQAQEPYGGGGGRSHHSEAPARQWRREPLDRCRSRSKRRTENASMVNPSSTRGGWRPRWRRRCRWPRGWC